MGVMLATWQAYRPASWTRMAKHANVAALLGVAVLVLAFWLFRERTGLLGNSIGWPVLSLALALLVFAGAQPHGWLGKRALPGAAWIAAISFSLYLVHKPMYGVVQSRLGEWLEGRGIVAYAVYGAASLLAAALLYYAVEKPFLRLRGRVLSRDRVAPPLERGLAGCRDRRLRRRGRLGRRSPWRDHQDHARQYQQCANDAHRIHRLGCLQDAELIQQQ